MSYLKETGIVIKKTQLADNHLLITLFSRDSGKIVVAGYGVKKIVSRRLSHLELGNYVRFVCLKKNDRLILSETELIWGFSKIRRSTDKLNFLFLLFFILNKILAENQAEPAIFDAVVNYLKRLNSRQPSLSLFSEIIDQILLLSGFITRKQIDQPAFDSFAYVENLIGQKIKREFF